MKREPVTISMVMTPTPHSVASDLSVNVAHQRMRNLGVRHLLVTHLGKAIGIVTDLSLLTAIAIQSSERTLSVRDVASSEWYAVAPSTPLEEVAEQMAANRYASVVIQDDEGNPLGIFTTVDACRVLAYHLKGCDFQSV